MRHEKTHVCGYASPCLLREIPLFSCLSEGQFERLARMAILRDVPRHTTIVRAGDKTDALYVIVSGSARVLNQNAEGHEVILSLLGDGECFGEMGLLDGLPRSADVQTCERCELLEIAKSDFIGALAENPELCLGIMRSLVVRLREADHKIESLALMDVYGRVARLLLDFSCEEAGRRVIRRKLSKQEIAKMVGASREMVSRVMKNLEMDGYVHLEGDHLVLRAH